MPDLTINGAPARGTTLPPAPVRVTFTCRGKPTGAMTLSVVGTAVKATGSSPVETAPGTWSSTATLDLTRVPEGPVTLRGRAIWAGTGWQNTDAVVTVSKPTPGPGKVAVITTIEFDPVPGALAYEVVQDGNVLQLDPSGGFIPATPGGPIGVRAVLPGGRVSQVSWPANS